MQQVILEPWCLSTKIHGIRNQYNLSNTLLLSLCFIICILRQPGYIRVYEMKLRHYFQPLEFCDPVCKINVVLHTYTHPTAMSLKP
jgi:hypothetical protein